MGVLGRATRLGFCSAAEISLSIGCVVMIFSAVEICSIV
uniref:Uncharacterized protein n=1 Tax=Anguilla anguilla TaxID=7936 RepID=A0A0E9QRU2_ANGAN